MTKVLKQSTQMVYASYALSSLFSKILPRTIPRRFVDSASKNFTLSVSNTPGPIKSLYYVTPDNKKIFSKWAQTYVMVAGYVGMCISCMSFCESFKVSVTCDESVMDKESTKRLCKLIEDNIK